MIHTYRECLQTFKSTFYCVSFRMSLKKNFQTFFFIMSQVDVICDGKKEMFEFGS